VDRDQLALEPVTLDLPDAAYAEIKVAMYGREMRVGVILSRSGQRTSTALEMRDHLCVSAGLRHLLVMILHSPPATNGQEPSSTISRSR
jgi:hypothetical protein